MVKRKLGRGLGSLLENALDETGKVIELDISKIHPNPWQPRRQFDFKSLEDLAASIKEKGLIQPITVRYRDKDGDFEYELVTGERRLRAADLAGLKTVPAIVSAYDDRSMAEVALIENLQREDLNPIEECEAYQQLMNHYGLTQEQMAAKVGKSRSYIANMLRLADFPDEVKKLMVEGKLTTGQARPLLGLSSGEEQVQLAKQIVDEGYATLEKTPDMLPVLKEAGVVDSGGQGLMCIMEGAYLAFIGQEVTAGGEEGQPEVLKYSYCVAFKIRPAGPLAPESVNNLISPSE